MSLRGISEVWREELRRGFLRLAAGEEDAAAEHFARAYACAPGRPEVCFALGRERLRRGDRDGAAGLLRDAWRADPGLVAAAAALARCLGALGGGYDVLDEAQRRSPNEPGLWVVRAELLLGERRIDEARAALDRASVRATGRATHAAIAACRARAFHVEAENLADSGRIEEALFAYKRAADLDPSWSAPHQGMGEMFSRLGRAARARACFDRARVLDG